MPASPKDTAETAPVRVARMRYRPLVRRIVAVKIEDGDDFPGLDAQTAKLTRIVPGTILLFDDNFVPIDEANEFLIAHCKSLRPASQKAYAEDLAQWWTYLIENGFQWHDVERGHVDDYAEALEVAVSPKTGKGLANGTLARRLGTVELFYLWAYRTKRIADPLSPLLANERSPSDRWSFKYGRSFDIIDDDRTRIDRDDMDEHVNPIMHQDLLKILEKLGPDPAEPWNPKSPSIRDRLIAETALFTGMRIGEICGLTARQILGLRSRLGNADPWTQARLTLLATKGRDKRTVLIPGALWRMLLRYHDSERQAILAKVRTDAEEKGERPPRETDRLFVNGLKANLRDRGRKATTDTVTRAFTRAVADAGLCQEVSFHVIDAATGLPSTNPDTGAFVMEDKLVPKHSFHDLRHTFAVNWYKLAVKNELSAPLKRLQALLGHRQLDTTADIYLRWLDIDEVMLSDGYARVLEGQIRAVA